MLYIFWFLHQTTTTATPSPNDTSCISFDSYIKPQQQQRQSEGLPCCISFDSYIKPQRNSTARGHALCCISFDSYIKPQLIQFFIEVNISCISFDSYIKPQLPLNVIVKWKVVYLLIPTSNHNWWSVGYFHYELYIFWFLHQTTTVFLYL